MISLIDQPNVRLLHSYLELLEIIHLNISNNNNNDYNEYVRILKMISKLTHILYPHKHINCKLISDLLLKTEQTCHELNISFQHIPNVCYICQKNNVKHRCSQCKNVYYCGRLHQKIHWKIHKNICK